ncbi:aminotransferase class I/II-fold pyridoxal phosphate-dependent enzyme [Paenibacillus marinisediminis]
MSRDDRYKRAPIVEALLEYEARGDVSLHVPGHKDGAAYALAEAAPQDERMAEVYRRYAALLRQDVTEIDGTDDLHQPTGAIREAQELAAACFGAEETHFLVGGSTVGNVAAVMACCTQPSDIVIVQRNVHKSVLNGLRLAGARAVFLSPRVDKASGLMAAPAPDTVHIALQRYPQAKAVVICSPNYYGLGVDVKELAAAAHAADVPLLVDEAHGAHYGMHPELPSSALQAGADAVVQSTHKMLGGMTMTAMLHVQGARIDRHRLKRMLTMVQSSSPSYPLLASLDMSRQQLATQGEALFTAGLEAVSHVRAALAGSERFAVMSGDAARFTQDPFKVVISDRTSHWSGYELLEKLAAHGCVAEMADERYVVLLFTFASTMMDAVRLLQALKQLEAEQVEHMGCVETASTSSSLDDVSLDDVTLISDPMTFSIYESVYRTVKTVEVEACAGYDAAESVVPYPPGIPLLYAGERITEQHAAILKRLSVLGAKCQEMADPTLRTIQVYD